MKPMPQAKKDQARPVPKVVEPVEAVAVGEMKGYTIKLDTELHKVFHEFAIKYDLSMGDVLGLFLAVGMDALTGDTLKPFAKVSFPAIWDYLARNKPYVKTVSERYQEYLKSLKGKVEIKREE